MSFCRIPTAVALIGLAGTCVPAFAIEGMTRPDFENRPLFGDRGALLSTDASSHSPTAVPFSISVNFSGDSSFEQSFLDAAAFWESLVPFYLDGRQGTAEFSGLTIDAAVSSIDGAGGTLGSAGPTAGGTDDSGFVLATEGEMTFDSDDFDSPTDTFNEVVLHEMAHVMGIGTLWTNNGLYDPGLSAVTDPVTGEPVGQYTGAAGVAGWQAEFDSGALYVPVEKGGGQGTANGHWNEIDGGSGPTGYVSAFTGQDAQFELLSGWLNPGGFVSGTTLGSFEDLGYDVESTAVPEPKVVMLAFGAATLLLTRRCRRC